MNGRIIVIGGGPAGLMAAGRAAELGAAVLLLEKTARLGNKLRLTGGGRCNLTNTCPTREFPGHLAPHGVFLRNALARFDGADLRAFMAAHGLPTVAEADGRVFPADGNAHRVAEALRRYCIDGRVQFRYNSPARDIVVDDGRVGGVRLAEHTLSADAVILATGGCSYPTTGSTGDGFKLAARLGHTVSPLRPGLVSLVTAEPWVRELQGLALPDVAAALEAPDGATLAAGRGELLFTHFGVSGPLALRLSLYLGDALRRGPLTLSLDLVPDLSADALDGRLRADLASAAKSRYHSFLRRWMPRSLAPAFAGLSEIPAERRCSELSAAERRRLGALLKRLPLTITRPRPLAEAMVTVGGIVCNEIVPQTMASRRVAGLYFAGEIIDLAGDTGGFNLQVAFTTGRVAGESAAGQIGLTAEHRTANGQV